jgi:hypothetical protein
MAVQISTESKYTLAGVPAYVGRPQLIEHGAEIVLGSFGPQHVRRKTLRPALVRATRYSLMVANPTSYNSACGAKRRSIRCRTTGFRFFH